MIRVARRTRGSSGSTLRLASLLLALVPACAVGPDYVEPEPEAPDVWQKDLLRGLKAGEGDLRTWWTQLDDPVLDGLVARASEGSLDLQQAVARVQEARSVLGIAKGDWFPSVDAIGSAQQTRLSKAVTDVVPPPA
ncbi:MAG: TolC family protein, partial [Deltaproteobacteria bacterium]